MIVDLLRNDLGKICQTGSVQISDLYKIETFKTVHHMVTKVYGKLKDNISEIEIIKSPFPWRFNNRSAKRECNENYKFT